jgi:hypothetical protein
VDGAALLHPLVFLPPSLYPLPSFRLPSFGCTLRARRTGGSSPWARSSPTGHVTRRPTCRPPRRATPSPSCRDERGWRHYSHIVPSVWLTGLFPRPQRAISRVERHQHRRARTPCKDSPTPLSPTPLSLSPSHPALSLPALPISERHQNRPAKTDRRGKWVGGAAAMGCCYEPGERREGGREGKRSGGGMDGWMEVVGGMKGWIRGGGREGGRKRGRVAGVVRERGRMRGGSESPHIRP